MSKFLSIFFQQRLDIDSCQGRIIHKDKLKFINKWKNILV